MTLSVDAPKIPTNGDNMQAAEPETGVGFRVKLGQLRAAVAAARGAANKPPVKGAEEPRWPLHGIQFEVGSRGLWVVGTDGKRMAVIQLGEGPTVKSAPKALGVAGKGERLGVAPGAPITDARTALVDQASLARVLREAHGSEVEVRIVGEALAIGGAAVAPLAHSKERELPPWRDVLPFRNTGQPYTIRSAAEAAQVTRRHVDELLAREAADRARWEPVWRKAAEELPQARAVVRELRAAQRAEVAALRARLTAAKKDDRAAIRAELKAKRAAHAETLVAPLARRDELAGVAKNRGGWDVTPSGLLTITKGTWSLTTRDLSRAGSEPITDAFHGLVEGEGDARLGVNTWFLTDALASFKGAVECRIRGESPGAPLVFYGRGASEISLTCIVMPIHLG